MNLWMVWYGKIETAHQEGSWFKTCWQMLCPWPHILINAFAPLKLNHCTALIMIRYRMLPILFMLCFNQPLVPVEVSSGHLKVFKAPALMWLGFAELSLCKAASKRAFNQGSVPRKVPCVASPAQFSSSRKIPFYPLLPFNSDVCICYAKLIVNTFFVLDV